jgi:hypothetical protein
MANFIYMMQISKDEEFTETYYTKLFTKKETAIKGYNFNKTVNETSKLGDYIRLLKIDMSLGIGTDYEGETIKQNFK